MAATAQRAERRGRKGLVGGWRTIIVGELSVARWRRDRFVAFKLLRSRALEPARLAKSLLNDWGRVRRPHSTVTPGGATAVTPSCRPPSLLRCAGWLILRNYLRRLPAARGPRSKRVARWPPACHPPHAPRSARARIITSELVGRVEALFLTRRPPSARPQPRPAIPPSSSAARKVLANQWRRAPISPPHTPRPFTAK